MSNESKCPFHAQHGARTTASMQSDADWWPNQLNLKADAEAWAALLPRRELELAEARAAARDGVAGTAGCGSTCPAEAQLTGRCVLYIGGRTGLVEGYRRMVETRGGRFLHHDGGQ